MMVWTEAQKSALFIINFDFATYMFLASSRFRFIYLTTSSELIGDFRDSLIFCIFLSDASL